MLGLLQAILCVLQAMATYVLIALVDAVNGLVLAVGLLIAAVCNLMPALPAAPGAPDGILGYLNWFVPIGPLTALLATWIGVWSLFVLARIALRWVKAL